MFKTTKRKVLFTVSILVIAGILTALLVFLLSPRQNSDTGGEAVRVSSVSDGCITEQGIYFMTSSNHAIRFYDFQAQKTVYLCTKPNCAHKEPADPLNLQEGDCEAYLTFGGFMTAYSGKLYYTYPAAFNQDDIYRCELDGTNRQKVGTIEGEVNSGVCHLKDGKLYYVCQVFDEQNNNKSVQVIQALDLESGRTENLTETVRLTENSFEMYSVCGFYGDQLIYDVMKHSDKTDENVLLSLNPENGEQKTLLDAGSKNMICFIRDDRLLIMLDSGDAKEFYEMDPQTGEKQRIELPFGEQESFFGIRDGKYSTIFSLDGDITNERYRFYENGQEDYIEIDPTINEEYDFALSKETEDLFVGYAADQEGGYRDLVVIDKQAFYNGEKEYTLLSQAG